MKLFFKIAFVFLVTAIKAQPRIADRISITKAELAQKEKISDFAIKISKGCIIQHHQISYHARGKSLLVIGNSDTLSEECKNVFKRVDFNSPLGVDVVYKCGPKLFGEFLRYQIEKR